MGKGLGRGANSPDKSSGRARSFRSPDTVTGSSRQRPGAPNAPKKRGRKRGGSNKAKTYSPKKKRSQAANIERDAKQNAIVRTAQVNQQCNNRGHGASKCAMVTIFYSNLGPVKGNGADKSGDNKDGAFGHTCTVIGPADNNMLLNTLKAACCTVKDKTEGLTGTEAKLPPGTTGSLIVPRTVVDANAKAASLKMENGQSSKAVSSATSSSCSVIPQVGNCVTSHQLAHIGNSTKNSHQTGSGTGSAAPPGV